MKIQNIIKSISAVIGLLAALFLIRIILAGDEDIKMAASMGEYGKVSALVELARIVLLLSVAITLIFSLRGLFSDIKKLKKAGISIGFFLIIIMISSYCAKAKLAVVATFFTCLTTIYFGMEVKTHFLSTWAQCYAKK